MSNNKKSNRSTGTLLGRNNAGMLKNPSFLDALLSPSDRGRSNVSTLNASSLGLQSTALTATKRLKSVSLGKPSASSTSSSSSSSGMLQSLLSQTASGSGLASAFTGEISSIAGLGGLFSDFASLFGSSKSTPPPLALFSLPNSVQETAYVSAAVTGSGGTSSSSQAGSVTYSTGASPISNQNGGSAADSAAIAQAVKSALLTSNSLGDVIAEL